MGEFLISPSAIARCDQAPQGGTASLVNEPNDGFAVHRGGNCLPEVHLAEPFLLPLDIRRCFFDGVIQIEEKKVVLEAGSGIHHRITTLLLR